MNPAAFPHPSAAHPAGRQRLRPLAKAAAAFFLLNALLSMEIPYPRMDWGSLLRPSPESLGLLLGMAALSRPGRGLPPLIQGLLTASFAFLKLFQAADRLVPLVFNREFNLLMDSQRLPDLILLFWLTRPPALVLLGLAATLAAIALFAWAVDRALTALHRGLADGLPDGPVGRLLTAAGLSAAIAAAAAAPPGILGRSTLPRVAAEIGFMLKLDETRARHDSAVEAAIERARRTRGDVQQLARASVFLVVVESYGMSAFSDPRHAPTVLPAVRTAEAELQSAGWSMCSAFRTAPTFGGGSWLSHATLASGVRIDSQLAHDLLLESRLMPLAEYFNRAGHRTVRVMPGTLWPWPEGRFYRYRETFIAPDFGYRGPAYGFAPMPDQFVLDWVGRRVLPRTPGPLFAEIILTGSHAAFDIQAPLVADWSRIGDGALFHGLAPRIFPGGWAGLSEASPAYSAVIAQEILLLKEFIRRFLQGTELVVIVGDHQPCVELIGHDQPWSVPVHVLSGDAEFTAEFLRRGFAPGLVPQQPAPHPGLETLFWDLVEGFSGTSKNAGNGD
jgi:hypothetical protein